MQFILSKELKQQPYVDHGICSINRLLGILLIMLFVKLQYFVISTLFRELSKVYQLKLEEIIYKSSFVMHYFSLLISPF
jgi:hypothetical protein